MDNKNRKSIRIKGYDYSQNGAYFVTICTHNRQCLFGQVESGKMVLNKLGLLIENVWREIAKHYETVLTGEFVIMPNHIHGIIWLQDGQALLGAMNHAPTQVAGEVSVGAQLGAMNRAPTQVADEVNVGAQLGAMNHAPTQVAHETDVGAQLGVMNHAPTQVAGEVNVGAQFIAPKTNQAAQFIVPNTCKKSPTLGEVVRAFKARASQASKAIRPNDSAIWQRNYYEHVVRNEPDLHTIREYINNNPKQWHLDSENPDA